MIKDDLEKIWQRQRNASWQEEERFVEWLIKNCTQMYGLLNFLATEKYMNGTTFKHVEGTVSSKCREQIAEFNSSIGEFE